MVVFYFEGVYKVMYVSEKNLFIENWPVGDPGENFLNEKAEGAQGGNNLFVSSWFKMSSCNFSDLKWVQIKKKETDS